MEGEICEVVNIAKHPKFRLKRVPLKRFEESCRDVIPAIIRLTSVRGCHKIDVEISRVQKYKNCVVRGVNELCVGEKVDLLNDSGKIFGGKNGREEYVRFYDGKF